MPTIWRDVSGERKLAFASTLRSIREQTLPPREVILGLSEATAAQGERIKSEFQPVLGDIELVVTCIEGKGSVGMNRNRAAAMARSDIISFFDADGDVMHQQRLEYIYEAFLRSSDIKVVTHGFSASTARQCYPVVRVKSPTELCQANLARHQSNLRQHLAAADSQQWILAQMHHGHLSISRSVFQQVKFVEDFLGQEDSIYVNTVVELSNCEKARAGIFIDDALTLNYLARSQKQR